MATRSSVTQHITNEDNIEWIAKNLGADYRVTMLDEDSNPFSIHYLDKDNKELLFFLSQYQPDDGTTIYYVWDIPREWKSRITAVSKIERLPEIF